MDWIAKPLADAYVRDGRVEEAKKVVDNYTRKIRQRWSVKNVGDAIKLAKDLTELSDVYFIPVENYHNAEQILREALGIRQKHISGQLPVYRTMYSLGIALARQQEFGEAEKVLQTAYDGFVKHRTQLTARFAGVNEVIEALIELYETWDLAEPNAGHWESAKQWKDKLLVREPNTD